MSYIKNLLSHYTWEIAYGPYSDKIIDEGLIRVPIHKVKNPYKKKWFADPFILEEDESTIQLLVEEFDYNVRKGRIARLVVNKSDNKIVECSIILELPTHLSFPVIYHYAGSIYVHPENSKSGASYIYRYDRSADKLVEPLLLINEPIADAIIRKDNGKYRMFATRCPDVNGCSLYEYSSEDLLGPYTYAKKHTFENKTARMAGMFLECKDRRIIRPAQDCFGGYGKAVILYDGHNPLCRIEPQIYKYAGIHTFNSLGDTFVIDYKKYDFPLIYRLSRLFK